MGLTKFLLNHGFDMNDVHGTPLQAVMWGAMSRLYETEVSDHIEFLINEGADVNLKDFRGKCALHVAPAISTGI